MTLLTDLLGVTDDILGVRDTIGAVIYPIYLTTRTWSGTEPGDGTATDVDTQILPSPSVKDLSHDWDSLKGGNAQQGDLLLQYISKQSYPSEDTVRCKSSARNIEKFYKINGHLYTVVSVSEKYVYWNVQIRKVIHT